MSRVRVKRQDQVTIAAELRARLRIIERDVFEVSEEGGAVVLTPPSIRRGEVHGKGAHMKVIEEPDLLRRGRR